MLVEGYKEMKPFLPAVEMKGQPVIFDDALDVAQNALVAEIIGTALESQLEQRQSADARLLKLCQRVISQQAFLSSIPDMDLILTDAGFGVVNNEQVTMASRERVQALSANLKLKLDDSKDALILYLLRTSAYDTWRGTEEFARLSDGLILTFGEFKDVAVLNNLTAAAYPHSWGDFYDLNSALNVALFTDVASYISKDFAGEIIEKVRDKETFTPLEKKVLRLIKIAISGFAMGDRKTGLDQTLAAVGIMRANLAEFPTYRDSEEAQEINLEHSDTPIFSML